MTDLDTTPSIESGETRLYSLVYSSTAVEPFDDERLTDLLEHSRRENGRSGITGMLLYRKGRFIQFLEGPEDRVRALIARITADPRHTGLRVMLDGHPQERQFADWTMGYERVSEPADPVPDGFRSTFDDLEQADDSDRVLRATRELSFWFRVRADRG